MSQHNAQQDDVVVTGLGMVTAAGAGLDKHWELLQTGAAKAALADYSLETFQPAPHFSDRRMLKAVSKADAIGIAAIEGLRKDVAIAPGAYDPNRVGLYVGAPPASAFDNEFYCDAMSQTKGTGPEGRMSVQAFGKTCMSSRPTTLLIGLPNNVLCYGAMLLDAKGPNSNYTATGTSGHMALINAAKRIERGQLDLAVAGGFSAHTEAVNSAMYAQLGLARTTPDGDGMTLADGAVFVALETRSAALARGSKPWLTYVAGALASDGVGPLAAKEDGAAFEAAVEKLLASAQVAREDIGLVFACASGSRETDARELSVLSRVFAKSRGAALPALGSSAPVLGHLMEAGGLVELGLTPRIYEAGQIPAAMRIPGDGAAKFASAIDRAKPYVLILRTSPWGEHSCVIVRTEGLA